jgi:antitoxin (DNA-binding transcriptional repressor) of toxin-antitoxin stability system
MVAIHVSELRERTDEILRRLQETRDPVDILDDGRKIATLVPAAADDQPEGAEVVSEEDAITAAIWHELEDLSIAIGQTWPAGVTAVEAVRSDRRDL